MKGEPLDVLGPAPVWHFTHHARDRMAEMRLGEAEVLDCLDHPELTMPPAPRTCERYGGAAWYALGGRLQVVYKPAERVVITVLWRDHDHERAREDGPCATSAARLSSPPT